MSAIEFNGPQMPTVDLGVNNWTDQALAHENLVAWWTLRAGRWSVDGTQRIAGCSPRAGSAPLFKFSEGPGPQPGEVAGLSGARFMAGELNGLHCDTPVPRDGCGFAVIALIEGAPPGQNRDLLGFYANGDAMRIWRTPAGQWSWRSGSNDGAPGTRPWSAGPLMILGERAGSNVRLRLRDLTGTGGGVGIDPHHDSRCRRQNGSGPR